MLQLGITETYKLGVPELSGSTEIPAVCLVTPAQSALVSDSVHISIRRNVGTVSREIKKKLEKLQH
jgi:hypothetical protein